MSSCSDRSRAGNLLAAAFALAIAAGCTTPTQTELDAEVSRLCAIDGGVRVYEQIKLPADQFGEKGQIKFFRPSRGENALGAEYRYLRTTHFYKQGNDNDPAMWRTHVQVFRRSDNTLLGESVSYTRRGGDVAGPWHPSSVTCPSLKDLGLLEQMFVVR